MVRLVGMSRDNLGTTTRFHQATTAPRLPNQPVVISVAADPKPLHPTVNRNAKGAVTQTNPNTAQFAIVDRFEVQRRMGGILLKQGVVVAGKLPDVSGQFFKSLPEFGRCEVPQTSRTLALR